MMEVSGSQSVHRKLVGVGLFFCGLLAGVLLLQFSQWNRIDVPAELRTVEFHTHAPKPVEQETGTVNVHLINEPYKRVSREVTRAVVSVHAASSWYSRPCAILKRGSQHYRERESLGSGVLISPQGYIVTTYHLVENTCGLRVTFIDKQEYDAEVVGVDKSTDLAVIQIVLEPDHEVRPLPLGNSDEVQTGEWVLAVGNPLALTSTVTAGIVSALGRRVNVVEDESSVEDFIQTDAAINPGNSGGALVNLKGELIGISTLIATESGYNEGYGFAIPVNLVDRVMRDLIAYGEVRRADAGVGLERIDARLAKDLGLKHVRGVYLDYVRRDGAAYQAGLMEGDVVLSVQGRPVNEPNKLESIIAQHRPGDSLAVIFWRRGVTRSLVVTLADKDDADLAGWINSFSRYEEASFPLGETLLTVERWGLTLRPLTDSDEQAFGVRRGVYIQHVPRGGIASHLGVPSHVMLQKINGVAVVSAEDAYQLLEAKEEALLTLLHTDGKSVNIHLAAE